MSNRNKKSITCSFNLLILCEISCFFFFFYFSNVEIAKQNKKRIEKKSTSRKVFGFQQKLGTF